MCECSPHLSARGISDLPLHVRAHIMSFLDNSTHETNVEISLQSAKLMDQHLPADMLVPAIASPTLSASVAHALGDRAKYLTLEVAKGKLAEWARALSPYVKAISFWDDQGNYAYMHYGGIYSILQYYPYLYPAAFLRQALDVFSALTEKYIQLEILDVTGVPFQYASSDGALTLRRALYSALMHNAETLRQLALPEFSICIKALSEIYFPKLTRLEIHCRNPLFVIRGKSEPSWENGVDLLSALNHMNFGTKGIELMLRNIAIPKVESLQSLKDFELFSESVERLELCNISCVSTFKNGEEVQFVSRFRNLKYLYWDGNLNRKNVAAVLRACNSLQEVHWEPKNRLETCKCGAPGDPSEFPEIFALLQGRLRTLSVSTVFDEQLITALTLNCTRLDSFYMHLGSGNVGLLRKLLTRCRNLRSLSLLAIEDDMLRKEGWEELSKAIALASPSLCKFEFRYDNSDGPDDLDDNDMLQSMASILRSLGKRGHSIILVMPIPSSFYDRLAAAITFLLNVAADCCENLLRFEIDFQVATVDFSWQERERKEEKMAALIEAKNRLQRRARKLRLELYDFVEGARAEFL